MAVIRDIVDRKAKIPNDDTKSILSIELSPDAKAVSASRESYSLYPDIKDRSMLYLKSISPSWKKESNTMIRCDRQFYDPTFPALSHSDLYAYLGRPTSSFRHLETGNHVFEAYS